MKNNYNLLILLGLVSLYSFGQIKKIEPPFWFENMKRSQVQLVLYGENLGDADVFVNGKKQSSIHRTENSNYLFLDWETHALKAGNYTFVLKKSGKKIDQFTYELKTRKSGSSQREGFNASDAIYLIMPDRFSNGDPANDSTDNTHEVANRQEPFGRHGGDLQGIINHLDYIQSLGVTTLWNTPVLEDNDFRGSYHGYACSDTYAIDARFGSNESFLKLSEALHLRGMKLIKDYVTNHWSLEHYLIKDLPSKDWIHYFDGPNGYKQTNYRMGTIMDPNRSQEDSMLNEKGWFVPSMPDLNQSNPLVLNYLIDNAIWWVEYADLDGYRVDTYPYNDRDGITAWTRAIMEEYPNFNIVGESWYNQSAQISYWQKDSKIAAMQGFNSFLPSVMDFPLADVIFKMLGKQPGWNEGIIEVYNSLSMDFLYPDVNRLLLFVENHDTSRFNEFNRDVRKFKIAMTLLATLRGIPQVYYGSEIGMEGDKSKGDADLRKDFPGGWEGDAQNAFLASDRTEMQQSYLDVFTTLFQWRKNQEVVHSGKTVQFVPRDQVYVYFRILDQKKVMVVINGEDKEKTLDLSYYHEQLNGFKKGLSLFEKNYIDVSQPLLLKGWDAKVFQLQ